VEALLTLLVAVLSQCQPGWMILLAQVMKDSFINALSQDGDKRTALTLKMSELPALSQKEDNNALQENQSESWVVMMEVMMKVMMKVMMMEVMNLKTQMKSSTDFKMLLAMKMALSQVESRSTTKVNGEQFAMTASVLKMQLSSAVLSD